MKRGDGFTFIEVMNVVAVVVIVAAIVVPGLLNAKKVRNETEATAWCKSLSTVIEQYHTRFHSYAGGLAQLRAEGYVDDFLGSGKKAGYNFRYSAAANAWTLTASPVTKGLTGDKFFFVDQSAVIRFSSTGPATPTSTPVE